MKILHIYKSKPDETTRALAEIISEGKETAEFGLYDDEPDFERLIDLVFECDESVSWW